MSPVGRTKDAGWQIGVSRTFPVPVEQVWDVLTSEAGVSVWLGEGVGELPTERGAPIEAADGARGDLRSHRPLDRVRVRWRPAGAARDSTIQVALTGDARRTTVRFHQERLADAEEREAQRRHWEDVVGRLAELGGW